MKVVLVDATECEIERPKKNSGNIIQEKYLRSKNG